TVQLLQAPGTGHFRVLLVRGPAKKVHHGGVSRQHLLEVGRDGVGQLSDTLEGRQQGPELAVERLDLPGILGQVRVSLLGGGRVRWDRGQDQLGAAAAAISKLVEEGGGPGVGGSSPSGQGTLFVNAAESGFGGPHLRINSRGSSPGSLSV